MTERAIVIHATSALARAYATVSPGRIDTEGRPTHALYALLRAWRTAVGFKKPAYAVAILAPHTSVQGDADYVEQHARLPELLTALGVPTVEAEGAEHLVASYAAAFQERGDDVVVVGTDKRLAQLVRKTCWWYDANKDARYTPEMVRKRFCVLPEKAAAWLAMVGDDDTLPGVKGIGKKGATDALETYGSIEGALDNLADIKGRLGNALRAAGEGVRAEVSRAILDASRPLPRALSTLGFSAPSDADADALHAAYGFFDQLTVQASTASPPVQIVEDAAALEAVLETFGPAPIALEVVTGDPSPPRGDLVGLALAQPGGPHVYIPLSVPGGVQPSDLAAFLGDAGRAKVGHNIKGAITAFARRGVAVDGIAGDCEHASHLAQPSGMAPHDLPRLSRRLLHRALVEEDAVRGVGRKRKPFSALSPEVVGGYAAGRAEAAAALWDYFSAGADRTLMREYADLAATLVRMEVRGMACDADDLAASGEDFERIGADLAQEIYALAGREFLLSSTKQLGTVLFEDLGLPVFRRTKTGWSTSNEALERIAHAHPIVPLALRWRRLRRLTDTWVTSLRASIDDDGRVRSTFHPARSFSGRLVNSHPDLGRVPGRTPEMQRIRHAFAAPPGSVIMSVDYTQLGLYVLAHLTEDPALVEPLLHGGDIHAQTASAVLDIPAGEVTADQRQLGKVVNFATFASQGASALAQQLGKTAAEAKEIIARFHKRYATVHAFHEEQLRLAQTQGHVVTIAGRKWPIGDLDSPDLHIRGYAERLARRATHEASVADVSRRGLLFADRALVEAGLDAAPLHSILDEVLFEVREDELAAAARIAAAAMRKTFALRVPLKVGVKVGPNWADLEPVDLAG